MLTQQDQLASGKSTCHLRFLLLLTILLFYLLLFFSLSKSLSFFFLEQSVKRISGSSKSSVRRNSSFRLGVGVGGRNAVLWLEQVSTGCSVTDTAGCNELTLICDGHSGCMNLTLCNKLTLFCDGHSRCMNLTLCNKLTLFCDGHSRCMNLTLCNKLTLFCDGRSRCNKQRVQ